MREQDYISSHVMPFCPIETQRPYEGKQNLQRYTEKATRSKLATLFLLVVCLDCSSTLKIEAVRSSEMSVNFYRTTRRHIIVIAVRTSNPHK
jgi:hypothetical protein